MVKLFRIFAGLFTFIIGIIGLVLYANRLMSLFNSFVFISDFIKSVNQTLSGYPFGIQHIIQQIPYIGMIPSFVWDIACPIFMGSLVIIGIILLYEGLTAGL
jgi:hypothetical protein